MLYGALSLADDSRELLLNIIDSQEKFIDELINVIESNANIKS